MPSTSPTCRAPRSRARERAAALTVAAPADGVFTLAVPGDMIGRYYKQGEVLGFVLGAAQPVVRVIVEQALVDAVSLSTRQRIRKAEEAEGKANVANNPEAKRSYMATAATWRQLARYVDPASKQS